MNLMNTSIKSLYLRCGEMAKDIKSEVRQSVSGILIYKEISSNIQYYCYSDKSSCYAELRISNGHHYITRLWYD